MSSADSSGGGLFCSDAVAEFHVDDCRETEIWFECLKEAVIVPEQWSEQVLLCSRLYTPGDDRFHRAALIRLWFLLLQGLTLYQLEMHSAV